MTCEISPRFHSRWRFALGRFFSPCSNPPQQLDLAAIERNPKPARLSNIIRSCYLQRCASLTDNASAMPFVKGTIDPH